MRRIVLTTLVALAVPGAAQAATPPEVPVLAARLDACLVGATAAERSAEFTGAMPAAEGASVLSVRFDLELRRGSVWKPSAVPGFRTWQRSVPGAAGLVYAKRVERLAAGATYRVAVSFRWTAADGQVVKRATRRSRPCRQPDLRPDLAVLGVALEPRADGGVRYLVRVRNAGPGAVAGPVGLGLAVDGAAQAPQAVQGLAAGAVIVVAFDAPACRPGDTVRADVDPDGRVEEAGEADNAFVLRCA